MSLINELNTLLDRFEAIPSLSDSDKEMLLSKRQALPKLLDELTAASKDDEGTYSPDAQNYDANTNTKLRQLHATLASSGITEVSDYESLVPGLNAFVKAGMPDSDLLDNWGRELDSLAPRVPGTKSMDEASAYLIQKLRSFGINTWSEPIDFRGVFFHEWSFKLLSPSGRAFTCFPQNNVAFGDIKAEIVDVGHGKAQDYVGKDVRGKIVLVNWGDLWDHEGPCAARERYTLLALYDIAVAQGAAAMVGYFSDTPGNALKLVEPGIRPIGGSNIFGQAEASANHQFQLPALNIGTKDALELKAILSKGSAQAHLVIKGVRKVSSTQSVIGFLPGQSSATIAIAAHSCTAFEGAVCDTVGVVGALAQAHYFSQLPLQKRKKSLLFFFDSFHVWGNCCQTANMILKEHATLAEQIEAFIWLDHISDGQCTSDRLTITSDHPILWPLANLASAHRGIKPLALPIGRIWSFCATGAFERRGVPALTMQALGNYVLTTEDTWDKFNIDVVARDILANTDIVSALMELNINRNIPGEPIGGCGTLFTSTELASYPQDETYQAEEAYPLYIGGEHSEVEILKSTAEKKARINP
ncbi:MAG: hypothetical protein LBG97_01925 [Coriobacteriales bacterium]|jgi:hypothetical protein|nr:hypothetical protein [Coriobacteriales bacterium]